ncbi:MAG: UDP-glucose 4-epimerase GalE [Sphingobacteriales bacterium]|nr:UDP-glucose 4-epimerase GalE [Sphingobacteriales bacterium]
MAATVLVAGGLGYIGSHTSVELIKKDFNVIVADNLSNSEFFILERIEQITGVKPIFFNVDLTDKIKTAEIFSQHPVDVVIHFAAYKSVSESVKEPLKYFHNNLSSLINIIECMKDAKVSKLIFSSSATVYGQPEKLPVTESTPFQKALSAYGSTKQMGEEILEKLTAAGIINAVSLRYFNPVGAHGSALMGELPIGIPNNLFPYVMQTGAGGLEQLTVYGNDYDTPDGSCLRDYIHVVDLAKAHVMACDRLFQQKNETSCEVFNIGTGKPTSVLEIIKVFERCTGVKLNYKIGDRREGDAAVVYADITKANKVLGWKAELELDEMIKSSWKWELSVRQS